MLDGKQTLNVNLSGLPHAFLFQTYISQLLPICDSFSIHVDNFSFFSVENMAAQFDSYVRVAESIRVRMLS